MKNKIALGLANFLAIAVLLMPVFALADEKNDLNNLKNYLKNELQKELEAEVSKLLDSLHQSFVGIGISLTEARLGKRGTEAVVGLVEKVIKNSPAANAGIKENYIIVSVNGKPFTSAREFKKEVLGDGKPGRKVVLELLDSGNPLNMAKGTVQMETVLFGVKDKNKAAVLENLIKKEGADLVAAINKIAQSIIQKMDADPNYNPDKNESDRQMFNEAGNKFNSWIDDKEKEIDLLKAPQ